MNLQFHATSSGETNAHESFWPQLKLAISTTSGFNRWALEKGLNPQAEGHDLDKLVHSYLRQTLETLAY